MMMSRIAVFIFLKNVCFGNVCAWVWIKLHNGPKYQVKCSCGCMSFWVIAICHCLVRLHLWSQGWFVLVIAPSFFHTVLHSCLPGVIIRFSSWPSKKLLQSWRWALKSQDMNHKDLTQQSPAAEGQVRESRPWDLQGFTMVAWPVPDSWVGSRTCVCTPRQSSFPAPLIMTNCKY